MMRFKGETHHQPDPSFWRYNGRHYGFGSYHQGAASSAGSRSDSSSDWAAENSAPMPMDTKDAAPVGICLQSGDSHDDPRSGSLSSSSDSGGIAEDVGRGIQLSGPIIPGHIENGLAENSTALDLFSSCIVSGPNQKSTDERLLDLTNESGMSIVQRNGQRIYGGPPPGWKGPAPEKGCEIFCGKVPRDCFEDELVPIFTKVGEIYELRLMMDFSGSNRGFCFVRYTDREHAKRAVKELNNFEIRPNKFLGILHSVDNRKLWVSGIPRNLTSDQIMAEMQKLTDGVRDVILYSSQTDKSRTRGYAFVEYESHRAAALARRKLVPQKFYLGGQEIEKVDWAEPENEIDEEVMQKVKVLFVRNLMSITTEEQIRSVFESLIDGCDGGAVERVKKSKDYAFVHFSTREAAEVAKDRAAGLTLDDSVVEIFWSKPVDKQIYNTRKQLTKIFSQGLQSGGRMGDGLGFGGGGSGFDSPLHQLSAPNGFQHHPPNGHGGPPPYAGLHSPSNHAGPLFDHGHPPPMSPLFGVGGTMHRGILPRKRGAAGIRGLGAPGTTPPRRLIRIANAQHVSNPMGGEGSRDVGHGPPAFVKGMMYNGGGGFVVPGHDRSGGGAGLGGGLGFGGQGHIGGAGLHPHHAHPHAAAAAAHAPLGGHPFFYPPPSPSTDLQQQQAAALGSPGHPYQNQFNLLTAAFMDNQLANALSLMNLGGGGSTGHFQPAAPAPLAAASINGESSSNSGQEN